MYDDIIQRWLASAAARPELARATRDTYARVGAKLVEWHGSAEPPPLAEFVAARRAAGFPPRTIALELRVLSVATHWAEKNLGSPHPPTLPRLRIDPRSFALNHRTPTPAEAAAAIRAMRPGDWRMAARLIAATGARIGEVVALRSADLDVSSGRIAFGATEGASKTGVRWFPLDAATLRMVASRAGEGPVSMWRFGVSAPVQGLQRRIRRACQLARVPEFTPHGLRRMVIGRLLRANVDPATAASLTGHSVDVMLKYYHEVSDDDRRAAAERALLGVLDELPRV